jgi:hypothetical protein
MKADWWLFLAFAIGLVIIALTKNTDSGPRKEVTEATLLSEDLTRQEMVVR